MPWFRAVAKVNVDLRKVLKEAEGSASKASWKYESGGRYHRGDLNLHFEGERVPLKGEVVLVEVNPARSQCNLSEPRPGSRPKYLLIHESECTKDARGFVNEADTAIGVPLWLRWL